MTKREQRLLIKEQRILIKEHILLILWQLKVIGKKRENLRKRLGMARICLDTFIEKNWLLRQKERSLHDKFSSLRKMPSLSPHSIAWQNLWPITWRQRYMLGLR